MGDTCRNNQKISGAKIKIKNPLKLGAAEGVSFSPGKGDEVMDRKISNRVHSGVEHNSSLAKSFPIQDSREKHAGSGNRVEEKGARHKARQCKERKPYKPEYASLLSEHMNPNQLHGPWSFCSFAGVVKVGNRILDKWLDEQPEFRAVKERRELEWKEMR